MPDLNAPSEIDFNNPLSGLVRARTRILNALSEGVIIADREGRVVFVNPAAEQMYGTSRLLSAIAEPVEPYQLLTMDGDPFPPDRFPLTRAIADDETVQDERWKIRRSDGQVVIAIGSARPLLFQELKIGAVLTLRDDTARFQTEQSLRASQAHLAAMVEQTAVGIAEVDLTGRFRQVNERYCTLLGRTRDELLSLRMQDVTHPRDLEGNVALFKRTIETGEPFEIEKRYVRGDGGDVWVRNTVTLIRGPDGEPLSVMAVTIDIGAHHASEEALRASEQRYRSLVSASNQVIYRHNADWSEMRHLAAGGLLSDTVEPDPDWFGKYIHPDDQERIWAEIQQAIRTGTAFEFEHRLYKADGSLGWTHSRSVPILDEDGRIVEWFGVASDVTERREAEAAIVESEARFRNLADNSPMMVWVTEPDGTCTFLSKSWYEFTGQTKEEALGFGWLEAVHPDDRGWSGDVFKDSNAKQGPFRVEYRLRRKDGEYRWAIDAASPRFADDGSYLGYVGSVVDIHERKRDEALQVAQNRILELALEDRPVAETLDQLVRVIEQEAEGEVLGSILLLDDTGKHLLHGAAPSLPQAYNDAIHGVAIGPAVGSCGTAAYTRQEVYVSDIASDPLWRDFRELALAHGLHACWSVPILSGDDRVLGTFAMYHRQPREPNAEDLRLVDRVTRGAALIIERNAAQKALEAERQRLQTLNRTASTIAGELDLERVVQMVTDAGVELTGAQFGAFFYNVTDDAGESLMLYTLSGAQRSQFERFGMPRNTAVFDPTFSGSGVVRSDDITKDPRYGKNAPHTGMPKGHLPVVSYLAVPVRGRSGEVIGGLFFGHPEPGRFNEQHEALMTGIAGQAAVAIDNARLYRDAQREIANRMKAEQALLLLNESLESRVVEEIERRAKSEEALHQLQKMETVGQLSGGIAHDFNNLLQIIQGNLSLLRTTVGEDRPREQRWVENAIKGSERAAGLTQRLLAFSRRQPLAPRPLDPNQMLEGMRELLGRTLGETIELEIELEPDIWPIEADPNQLENALLNLVVNARDAMADGGRLTIETRKLLVDEAYAEQHAGMVPGDYVLICVSDEGPGMDRETLERAIEPFFTTKEVGKGTGLGLPMVYGFVQQSGGHFSIYSEVGEGTTAKIYLPRFGGEMAGTDEPQKVVAKLADERGRGELILLCEDDDDVRSFSSESLTDLGYRVLAAADAASALELLRSNGSVSLLFTDVILPGGMTGADLAEQARKIQPDLKVLFTTGYARTALSRKERFNGDLQVLSKPFAVSDLARRIRAMLDE